ncbi:hypothetical protein N0V90_002063 [Kalmusia sp. IMI 367209]|nr:hypothetical protein N0V90_002063 [Kalmusia sp. IMI 367209]
MAGSNSQYHIPPDNPLAGERFDEAMEKARMFWRAHGLGDIVDEDDFIKGALVFHDLDEAVNMEYKYPRHTDQERENYTDHQRLLSNLKSRQKTSIRRFGRKTKYKDEYETESNIVKKLFFTIIDFALDPFDNQGHGTFFVKTWFEFMWCRIILGVGMGAKASVVPIYLSETSPKEIRESPRWLLKKNRYREALNAQILLHQLPSPIIACGELYMIFRRLEAEEKAYKEELEAKKASDYASNHSCEMSNEMQDLEDQESTPAATLSQQNDLSRRSDLHRRPSSIYNTRLAQSVPILSPENLDMADHINESQSMPPGTRHSYSEAAPNSVSTPELNSEEPTRTRRGRSSHVPQLDDSHSNDSSEENFQTRSVHRAESLQASGHDEHDTQMMNDTQVRLENPSWLMRFRILWNVDHIRRQVARINILAFMSSITFAKAMSSEGDLLDLSPDDREKALIFSIYFGLVQYFSTLIPLFFIDGGGRRALLKFTFPFMALCLVICGGALFLPESESNTRSGVFYAFTILFTVVSF